MYVELFVYSLIRFLHLPSVVAPLLRAPNQNLGVAAKPFSNINGTWTLCSNSLYRKCL